MKKKINIFRPQSGFTLVEVVISALLLSIGIAGVLAVTSSAEGPGKQKIAAAFVGKQILEQLRAEVNAQDWDDSINGNLHPSGGPGNDGRYPLAPVVVGGTTYTPEYQVETDPDGTGARKVTLTIDW